jgi:hypothetical protein
MLGMMLHDSQMVSLKLFKELEGLFEESLLELSQISRDKGNDRKTASEVFEMIDKHKHQFLNNANI